MPFVGHPHADGHLMGVALALPHAITYADRQIILKSLAACQRIRLPDGRLWGMAAQGYDRRVTLQAHTWCRQSRVWTSVTPVVLDRYPKPKRGLSPTAIVQHACLTVNLPPPERITLHRHSHMTGVPPSGTFRVRRHGQPPRPFTHVTLQFAEPVAGPLMLGAGRFFGLGLFRPWRAISTGEIPHATT